MSFLDNSHRLQRLPYSQAYQSSYNDCLRTNYILNFRPLSQLSSSQNPYYTAKQRDDHRFDRAVLHKPAFLIKDQFLYPNQFQVSDRLDYANNLIQHTKSKHYYRDDAQQYRIRTMGQSPFDKSIEQISHNIKRRVRNDTFNPFRSSNGDNLDTQILKFRNNLHRQDSHKTKPIARNVYVLGLKARQEEQKKIKQKQKQMKQQLNLNQKHGQKTKPKYFDLNQSQKFDNPFERDSDQDSDFEPKRKNGYFSPIPEQEYSEHFGQKMGFNILSHSNEPQKSNRGKKNSPNYKQTKSNIISQQTGYKQGRHPQQISHKGKNFKRIL